MSRRALIVGIAVLLIASSLLVFAPANNARAAPAGPAHPDLRVAAHHPSFTTIQLYTSSGYDPYYNQTEYATGPYAGNGNYLYGINTLYFGVYDPTTDHSVNFTVTDLNATRDGVGSPAFTANVPINNTTFLYYSWQHGVSYTFPASLAIGGTWNVSVSGPLGGAVNYTIYVNTYSVSLAGNPGEGSVVLPTDTASVSWIAQSDVNGAADTHITNVAYQGWYWADNGTYTALGPIQNLTASPWGTFSVTVPANATPTYEIFWDFWASIQVNHVVAENHSVNGYYYLVGTPVIDRVTLASSTSQVCPYYNVDGFAAGSNVEVCLLVGATADDQFSPIANLPISIQFWDGSTHISAGAGVPTSLTTNQTGFAAFAFNATAPPFIYGNLYPYYNAINFTVTAPGATSLRSDWKSYYNDSFYLLPQAATAGLSVSLNQLVYLPGQTVTASWEVSPSDAAQIGPVSILGYRVTSNLGGVLLQNVVSSPTASSGSFTFTLPAGYTGEFELSLAATNATMQFMADTVAYSAAPTLTLTPNTRTYSAGNTLSVDPQYWDTGALSGLTVQYTIWAYYNENYVGNGQGGQVAAGTVANNSAITWTVPSSGAPSYYVVNATLVSGTAGTLAASTVEFELLSGYQITVGVNTQSNYADGSFQPGQTITVAYSITPYGNAPLPQLYTFSVELYQTTVIAEETSTSGSGTFQLTIPSNWPTGTVEIDLSLYGTYLYGGTYCYGGDCYGYTTIMVNAHPSVLSMELGAGSGVTVGWLILLILIIVVAVILLVLILRKGRSPPKSSPMNPPAPAPSSPPPAEWKEPASGSGGSSSSDQPPLPAPPPGAT